MTRIHPPLHIVIVASAFLATGILLLDIWLPLGVAAGVPYVAVVLAGWWLKHSRHIFVLALGCTVLTAIGYSLSMEAGIPWMVVTNRMLALFAIWVTAVLLAVAKRSHDELERRVDERTNQLQKEISEHERAEKELRLITNNVPAIIIYVDWEERYRFINKASEKWFRNRANEVIGTTVRENLGEAVYRKLEPSMKLVLGGEEVRFEETIRYPDGKERQVDLTYVPDFEADGTVRGFFALGRDITERKIAEEKLRASQRLLQTVFDTIPVGVLVKDAQRRYVMVNKASAARHNLDPADYIGKLTEELIPISAESHKATLDEDRAVLERGETLEIPETLIVRNDGTEEWHRVSKVPLFDEVGNVTGLVGVRENMTERKKFETSLLESEERFRTIFDNSPSAIFLKDLDGCFTMVNRAFEERRGLSTEEIIGKTSYDLFEKLYAEPIISHDREVLETCTVIDREHEVPLSDGSIRKIVNTKFPVRDHDGQVVGVGTIATDMTTQRTVEHHLRESQKMEAVGQLAGGIAHEFNNMLQVIINSAHFARDSLHESEKADEFLGTILKSAGRSAALTKQLLAYSRKTTLVRATVNLNDLTTNLMKMVKPVIGEEIELEFKPSEDLFPVTADASLLDRTLVNLCLNARDAMPDGGRLIFETRNHHADQGYCDIHGWKQPGDYAMVSVSDNGVGMTSEIREHIFEPFFTTKEVGQGTGLGLAMVHGIVEQHDGVVEVLSEPGVGSTFNIYLPRTDSQEARKENPVANHIAGGSETVLVAEDEEDVLHMLAKTLESGGYRVLTAKDGEEAMSVFKANADRIDLVILDMIMPKLRGRAVYEQIRESGSDVPVLFSTGYSLDSRDAEYVAGKGLRTIQKPYAPSLLYSTVREVLDERQPEFL